MSVAMDPKTATSRHPTPNTSSQMPRVAATRVSRSCYSASEGKTKRAMPTDAEHVLADAPGGRHQGLPLTLLRVGGGDEARDAHDLVVELDH